MRNSTIAKRLRLAAVCLFAGMVITVVVAWACVVFSTRNQWRRDDPAAAVEWAWWAPEEWPPWAELGEAERVQTTKHSDGTYGPGVHRELQSDGGFGVSERAQFAVRAYRPNPDPDPSDTYLALFNKYEVHGVAAGWPLRALRAGWRYEMKGALMVARNPAPALVPAPGLIGGLPVPEMVGSVAVDDAERLPVRPVGIGFVGNTLAYSAVVLVVMLAPGVVRRASHKRRGRCVGCGYSLAGSIGGVCPECGAGVAGSG